MMRWIVMGVALWAAACCRTAPPVGGTAAAAGTERGPCYGNGSCNDGLLCLSDLCVRPPPADCEKVAAHVGNLTLSNYAPAAERKRFESDMVTACKAAKLSREEGDCISSARNRTQLARCPKPLGLGRCDRMVAHIQTTFGDEPKVAQFLARGPARLVQECEREGITQAVEDCVMRAKTFEQVERCEPGR